MVRCRAGAVTNAGVWYGPGSAKQREERCIAPGTRGYRWHLAPIPPTLPLRSCVARQEPYIPGALSILQGTVPGRVRGSGHMVPTYFRRELRDRALQRPSRLRTFLAAAQFVAAGPFGTAVILRESGVSSCFGAAFFATAFFGATFLDGVFFGVMRLATETLLSRNMHRKSRAKPANQKPWWGPNLQRKARLAQTAA